jgi:hypothetical protein
MNATRQARLGRFVLAIFIGVGAVVFAAPSPAVAKKTPAPPKKSTSKRMLRTEKTHGVCVEVPTKLFPIRGQENDQVGEQGSIRVLTVAGPNERVVTLGAHASYANLLEAEKPGWVSEDFRVDEVTVVAFGYVVVGRWEGGESETGGPWKRRTYKQNDGSAVVVDFFFSDKDYKKNKAAFDALVVSTHTC